MSCATPGVAVGKEDTTPGCDGSHMANFDAQVKARGFTKDRDNSYKCSGGSALLHFIMGNKCKKYPWEGKCTGTANPNWWYGGMIRVRGEPDMKQMLVQGYSMYVSMDVYSNFMWMRKKIYTRKLGWKSGGHAVNLMGYGSAEAKKWWGWSDFYGSDNEVAMTDYWLIQNSWGLSKTWGENGYLRIERGINLVGIEENAFAPRAWVTGGKAPSLPACQDTPDALGGSGLEMDVPNEGMIVVGCAQAKAQGYCHMKMPKAFCPLSCDECKTWNAGTNGGPAR